MVSVGPLRGRGAGEEGEHLALGRAERMSLERWPRSRAPISALGPPRGVPFLRVGADGATRSPGPAPRATAENFA